MVMKFEEAMNLYPFKGLSDWTRLPLIKDISEPGMTTRSYSEFEIV